MGGRYWGYAFWQTTDDSGPNSAQGKARAYSIGPSIRYANPQGWLFTAKWEKDFEVRNRPEGSQIYLKASIPFKHVCISKPHIGIT